MATLNPKFIQFPTNNDNVYVIQNGAFVPVSMINPPVEWSPSILDVDTICLVRDNNMTPFQLTGLNSEVNI